jgi:hypothetical protein
MSDSNTYKYKVLNINGSYEIPQVQRLKTFEIHRCDLSFITPFFINPSYIENFKSNFSSITILENITVLIDELLKNNSLEEKKLDFYVLVCAIQKEYIKYFEMPFDTKDEMSADFQGLHKELSELLDLLHTYLQDANSIKKISFKSSTSVVFKNLFIIRDVLNTLLNNYDLTLDNFKQKKREILEDYTRNDLSKLGEKFKFETIQGLHNFITREKPSNVNFRNEDLRFVGSVLHLSQVSVSARSTEIILTDLKNLVSLTDISNLRNYLDRTGRYTI